MLSSNLRVARWPLFAGMDVCMELTVQTGVSMWAQKDVRGKRQGPGLAPTAPCSGAFQVINEIVL